MKQTAKRVVPPALWESARQAYFVVRRLPDLPAAYLHPWRRESMARLADLRNKYEGRRAFVIGNGPSLKNTDISRLRHEFTIGLNRIYLMFPDLGFSTSCLVSINDLVIEQCLHDLQSLTIPRFLSWRAHRFFPASTPLTVLPTFLHTTYEGAKFSQDVAGRVWEGATVTYVALQLAFHMGFQQVILIGVDHSFTSAGAANATIVSSGDDPNHFSPEYFGKGFRWQLPDLAMSEWAYTLAREAYAKAGREILDATVGGKLTVFPKVDYNSLIK
jgi:hypothetical protein